MCIRDRYCDAVAPGSVPLDTIEDLAVPDLLEEPWEMNRFISLRRRLFSYKRLEQWGRYYEPLYQKLLLMSQCFKESVWQLVMTEARRRQLDKQDTHNYTPETMMRWMHALFRSANSKQVIVLFKVLLRARCAALHITDDCYCKLLQAQPAIVGLLIAAFRLQLSDSIS